MEIIIAIIKTTILNVLRFIVIAGVPFLIFHKLFPKQFKVNRIQSALSKAANIKHDIQHSIPTFFVLAIIAMIMLKTPLREYTKLYEDWGEYPLYIIPVSIVVGLIIGDTYFYWLHRFIHHPRLFNKIHLTHHRSTQPNPFTSNSFNIIEAFLEGMILPIILFILPMHPVTMIGFTFINFSFNVYGHLGFEFAPKWFRNCILFEIINTGVFHNMHNQKFKGNYGLFLHFNQLSKVLTMI